MQRPEIVKLIDFFGSQTKVAKKLGIDQTAVSNWLLGKNQISTTNALKVQKITSGKIKAHELLPELAGLAPANDASFQQDLA